MFSNPQSDILRTTFSLRLSQSAIRNAPSSLVARRLISLECGGPAPLWPVLMQFENTTNRSQWIIQTQPTREGAGRPSNTTNRGDCVKTAQSTPKVFANCSPGVSYPGIETHQ